MGVDNLLRGDKTKLGVRFSVINLTDTEALYNFLSTFSGTHFVTPRTYQVPFVGRNTEMSLFPSPSKSPGAIVGSRNTTPTPDVPPKPVVP